MIPQEIKQAGRENELANLLTRLERTDFDIDGLRNLGPAHRSCNNQKGTTVYPDTILHERLIFIEHKVPEVERFVAGGHKFRTFEEATVTGASVCDGSMYAVRHGG